MIRGTYFVAALAFAAVTGCSEPRAGSLPPPATAPAAQPSTRAATPTPSADIRTELADAARNYYVTLQRVAADPRDAVSLDRLIHRECACREVVRLLERLSRDRHRLLFEVTVDRVQVTAPRRDSGTIVLRVSQTTGREVDARGNLVRTLPATIGRYAVDVLAEDGRWLVRRITRTSS